ncbi:MAG: DNA repair protein RadA [Bacteroidales bacterium]|nr:MAG: DNA repair protein RadA [Bacteroidales bacterium]
MPKSKTVYVCQNCGAEASKWVGKCHSCGKWNTYVEEIIQRNSKTSGLKFSETSSNPVSISEITSTSEKRIDIKSAELNRILGGGLVPGSLVLLGGEPGIGKSTLALQLALNLNDLKILYISGEESYQQIKLRANRLNLGNDNCFVLSEILIENIFVHIQNISPDIIIIDSVQTLQTEEIESSPGSVSQVRECASRLLKFSKKTSIPVILIGHITKDGSLAGPKILEHIVDTVLLFEGDHNYVYRILRVIKNRFGPTSEIGIFEMQNSGLKEITNPSQILISADTENMSGVSIAATMDGIRPFLIEVQALVSSAVYGMPQRSTTGFDIRRLNMLLAVLEKKAGFRLATKDVFLNIAGGIKVNDPAIDLSVICAILSSSFDKPINKKICFAGEVGLSGEIRPVNRIEQRIKEADKQGFQKILISNNNISPGFKSKIEITKVKKIENAIKYLFK